MTIENNHYVQICTTHRKHSKPFDPKYNHTLQSKNLVTPHNILLEENKKSKILAQSVFDLEQRTS